MADVGPKTVRKIFEAAGRPDLADLHEESIARCRGYRDELRALRAELAGDDDSPRGGPNPDLAKAALERLGYDRLRPREDYPVSDDSHLLDRIGYPGGRRGDRR